MRGWLHSPPHRAILLDGRYRDLGIGMVDRLPTLKRFFIREAAGLIGDVPKLLRGEAL